MLNRASRLQNVIGWIGAAALAAVVTLGVARQETAAPAIPPVGGLLASPPPVVHMLDARNGYGGTASLAVTHDGGATWSDVTPRDPRNAPLAMVKGYYTDLRTGWAFSLRPTADLTVYGTRDGGRSWSKLASVPVKYGDGGTYVTFADARHSWFEDLTAGMGQHPGELFATSDGGKTWNKVADTASKDSLPFGGQITAQKDGTLWLSGSQRAAGRLGGPGFIWLYRSTDGGRAWKQVRLPVPVAHQQDTTSVSPPVFYGNHGLLTVLYSSGEALVYASADGGQSWAVRGRLPMGAWPAFADALNGWQTDGRLLYRTQDGGRSWQRLAADSTLDKATSGRFITQLEFLDARHGWAVLEGRSSDSQSLLLTTSDGGEMWKRA